jgi:WD40 repeat protein
VSIANPAGSSSEPRVRIFLSYGRADAQELAERLEADLSLLGFEVWRDRSEIRSGREWDDQIEAGLRASQLVLAVLTPHAVREESVCRDELAFARFACKLPIIPALADRHCEAPFVIARLDYIDLTDWRDSPDQYKLGFKRLIDSIQAHLRGEPPRWKKWYDRFPHFDFGPFLYAKRADFVGREWLFQRIEAWRADSGRQRALLITGDPGIGKSTIVAQLVHQNPGSQVLAYHCCRADTPETLRPGRFVRSLAGMIASRLEAYAGQLDLPAVERALSEARCESDPASAFEEGILNPLHKLPAPPGGSRYILIDALDEALANREGPSLIALLLPTRLERMPCWLRVVATTRKDPEVLRRLSGLLAEEIRADEPDNLDDIEHFLVHRLNQPRLAKRMQASGVSAEDAIRRLREKSGGNFLWTEQALLSLETGTHDFNRLDALPSGLTGLYMAFFERQFPDAASYAAARPVLEVVTSAREPLSVPELADATALDSDYQLPLVLDKLTAYLPDRDGRRAVYHKSLADWLTDESDPRPAGRFFVSARRGQQPLSDSCWAVYQRDGAKRMPSYAIRHLPAHLVETAGWDKLASLLLDLSFLETKAEAGLVFDLAMDFNRSAEAISPDHSASSHLRLIGQAMRYDIQFIARHPTTLFQCLWNRCWWYDCPAAAAHYEPPQGGRHSEEAPWERSGPKLCSLMERWRHARERCTLHPPWLRALRPPEIRLGGNQRSINRGHEGAVSSVAFDATGRRIASGSQDGTVRVWDAATGGEISCLRGHERGVTSVSFDPTGRRIASGSQDRTVRVWDAATGAEISCLRGHADWVRSVAFDPTGRHIVSGSDDGTIRVWDASTFAEVTCRSGHEGGVNSVSFDPTGRHIASGSRDEVAFDSTGKSFRSGATIRIWDFLSDKDLACLRWHQADVNTVRFDPTGKLLASSSNDGTVRLWDTTTGAEILCLGDHPRRALSVVDASGSHLASVVSLSDRQPWVLSVAFDATGRRLASCGYDGTVRVWDVASGAEVARFHGPENTVNCVAFDPIGQRLASGSEDKTVRVWDGATGPEIVWLQGHEHWITCVAFDPTGRRVASGSMDKTVRVWDAATGTEIACLQGHKHQVQSVVFDPTGRRLQSGDGREARVWDTESSECLDVLSKTDEGYTPAEQVSIDFAWRASTLGLETVIEPKSGGQPVAWFSPAMCNISTHPSGRVWAGSVGNHLYIIELEGGPKPA